MREGTRLKRGATPSNKTAAHANRADGIIALSVTQSSYWSHFLRSAAPREQHRPRSRAARSQPCLARSGPVRRSNSRYGLGLSLCEKFLEQLLRLQESFFRQDHRFRLADGIRNEALLMEPVQGVPIKPFPRPGAVVQRQMEECEDSVIDFLGIDIHAR